MRSEETEILIKSFFEGWQLYTTVIENDYMIHRKIINLLPIRLRKLSLPLKVLEVGCGDSHVLSQVATSVPVAEYHGIDLSTMAIGHARRNLDGIVENPKLIPGNMDDVLPQLNDTYTVVLAGYTLHHFHKEAKADLFRQFQRLLKPNGCLLVYDLLKKTSETREHYLQRAAQVFSNHWTAFSQKQMEQIHDHVLHNDHPESWETWCQLAADEGFCQATLLDRDKGLLYPKERAPSFPLRRPLPLLSRTMVVPA